MTVFLPAIAAPPLLDDLRDNGQLAIVLVRPVDERSCQVKGRFIETWRATADEEAFAREQFDRGLVSVERVGIPRAGGDAWQMFPCVAVKFRAEALFTQTPGPNAGARLP